MNNKERFNYLFKGYLFGYLPFGILFGLLSMFNIVPVNVNDTPYYGVIGFGLMLLLIPTMAIMFTILNWVFLSFGLWVYSIYCNFKTKK